MSPSRRTPTLSIERRHALGPTALGVIRRRIRDGRDDRFRLAAGISFDHRFHGSGRLRAGYRDTTTASVVSPRRADGCFSPAMHKPNCSRPAPSAALLLLYASADPSGPGRASGSDVRVIGSTDCGGWLSLADGPSTG